MPELRQDPTLSDLQDYIKNVALERGWDKNNYLEIFLLFSEEVGELAKAIRNKTGLYAENNTQAKKAEVENEMADVLNYLLDLANYFEINLEEAFRKKDQINSKRSWRNSKPEKPK
ncbi:MAG: MazG nucleotide pyrophosphohydrolase domain-containing protein [Bacteroidota bacterium]|nr:MazG nucleotide pyrophosphohydrolase domain-containing protein [Bacteroidota bacterium]